MLATLPRSCKTSRCKLHPPAGDHSTLPGDKFSAIQGAVTTAAILTGLTLQHDQKRIGNGLRFRLRLSDQPNWTPSEDMDNRKRGRGKPIPKYARLNHKLTRRVAAVCWHGHRDFMLKLFDLLPTLTLRTGLTTYKGKEDFENKFPSTGEKYIGTTYEPCYYSDACFCGE